PEFSVLVVVASRRMGRSPLSAAGSVSSASSGSASSTGSLSRDSSVGAVVGSGVAFPPQAARIRANRISSRLSLRSISPFLLLIHHVTTHNRGGTRVARRGKELLLIRHFDDAPIEQKHDAAGQPARLKHVV